MKSIEICIPAYNEAEVIVETVREVSRVLARGPCKDWRITVADNGSTDGTAERITSAGLPHVHVLRVPGKGKGLAIRTCALQSATDLFGFIDADLSASPEHLIEFIEVLRHGADLVIGSRLHAASRVDRGSMRTLSSRAFNRYANLLLRVQVEDTQCGLKLMNGRSRKLLEKGTQDTWFFDLEHLLLLRHAGYHIVECPISWQEFRYGKRASKLKMLTDGLKAFRVIAELRLTYGRAPRST